MRKRLVVTANLVYLAWKVVVHAKEWARFQANPQEYSGYGAR